jgi:hypothetical protein
MYTVCYSADDGVTWKDSYIRFKVSQLSSLTASQATVSPEFFDHGHLGNYEGAVKLQLTMSTATGSSQALDAGSWVALVDEQEASNDPCESTTWWDSVVESELTISTSSPQNFQVGQTVYGAATLQLYATSGTTPSFDDQLTGNETNGIVKVISGSGTTFNVKQWSANRLVAGEQVCSNAGCSFFSAMVGTAPDHAYGSIDSVDAAASGDAHLVSVKGVYGTFASGAVSSYDGSNYIEGTLEFANNHFEGTDTVHEGTNPTPLKYVGAKGANNVVELTTAHLDPTKQYAACYKDTSSATWSNSGMRFTISKLHSIRYNAGQTPANNFRSDITTSRGKIGVSRCTAVNTATRENTCGDNLNEQCAVGSVCDPDLAPVDLDKNGIIEVDELRNGGCGSLQSGSAAAGMCTSGLGAQHYVCQVATSPESACDSDYDGVFSEPCNEPEHVSCSTDPDCEAYNPDSHCRIFGSSQQCMIGNQALLKYARCNPDGANNGGCGATAGRCVLMHTPTVYNSPRMNVLPQPGDASSITLAALSHDLNDARNDIVLMDSSANSGEPCLSISSESTFQIGAGGNYYAALPRRAATEGTELGAFLGSDLVTCSAECDADTSCNSFSFSAASGNCHTKTEVHTASSTMLAAGVQDDWTTYYPTGDAIEDVSLFTDAYNSALTSAATEYTVCYNGTGVGYGVDATTGSQWYDTFIRVKFSEIASVTHHLVAHSKQGHIPAAANFGLTYSGKLVGPAQIVLISEVLNSGSPCSIASADYAIALNQGLATMVGVESANQQVIFATDGLDVGTNYAVCYGTTSISSYADSGVRVTVSTIQDLEYNIEQYDSFVGEYRYSRKMYSSNVAVDDCLTSALSSAPSCASDSNPTATNRLPISGGELTLEYAFTNSTRSSALSSSSSLVLVDSSQNNNNPCMSWDDIENGQFPSQTATGVLTASSKRFTVPANTDLSATVTSYTACYCNLLISEETTINYLSCRDSYIRMEPSRVHTITTYGQEHKTTGTLASRNRLGLQVDRDLSATTTFPDDQTGRLALVEHSLNGYHPCAYADRDSSHSSWINSSYSGALNEHESTRIFAVKTEDLSSEQTFALCYSIDSGVTFFDAGLPSTHPKCSKSPTVPQREC